MTTHRCRAFPDRFMAIHYEIIVTNRQAASRRRVDSGELP